MEEQIIIEKWRELLYCVRRSFRYHTHRRKFFDGLAVLSDFLIILTGGTVVGFASAGEAKHTPVIIVVGSIIAIIGSLDLVIGYSKKSREFHDLAREFSALERRMVEESSNRTEANLKIFTNKRLEIEEKEPPILQVLNCYCDNELMRSLGTAKGHRVRITFLQSVFKQFFSLRPSTLMKMEDWEREKKERAAAKAAARKHKAVQV